MGILVPKRLQKIASVRENLKFPSDPIPTETITDELEILQGRGAFKNRKNHYAKAPAEPFLKQKLHSCVDVAIMSFFFGVVKPLTINARGG